MHSTTTLQAPPAAFPGARAAAAAPEPWRRAGRALVARVLGAFAAEGLLVPVADEGGGYRLDLPGEVGYRFAARRGAYDAWHVEPDTVRRLWAGGGEPAEDVLQFVLDAHTTLGLTAEATGRLVRELTAVLAADACAASGTGPGAARIADLGHAEAEAHAGGHPALVTGDPYPGLAPFPARDRAAWAPGARRPVRLMWVAVAREAAEYRAVDGLVPARLYDGELDPATRERLDAVLRRHGGDPGDHLLLPVHPWQWDAVVAPLFAPDIAAGRVVPLGEAPDRYLPERSAACFADVDHPGRCGVRLPLTAHPRRAAQALAAPAVGTWIGELTRGDAFLREVCRPILLADVATVVVRHPVLDELPGLAGRDHPLLAATWRAPLEPRLAPHEQARPLTTLCHVDPSGRAVAAELVERSGLTAHAWLARLTGAVLPPLLRLLTRHGLLLGGCGDGLLVVFDEDDVPVRLVVRDLGGDVARAAGPDAPPEVAAALPAQEPARVAAALHAGLFAGCFGTLADVAATHLGVPASRVWDLVRDEVVADRERDGGAGAVPGLDLLAPRVERPGPHRGRLLPGARAAAPTVANPLARTEPG